MSAKTRNTSRTAASAETVTSDLGSPLALHRACLYAGIGSLGSDRRRPGRPLPRGQGQGSGDRHGQAHRVQQGRG